MNTYLQDPPARDDLAALEGLLLLEFGTGWCGFCRAARPIVDAVAARHPELTLLRIEDGPGRALGRSFRVKLWPTLILVSGGQEIGRVVRPSDEVSLEGLLRRVEGRA